MKILAVDSVGKTIQVVLINDDKTLKKELDMNQNASEYLLSIIDNILTESNVSLKDLDYLALNVGPGSFTGIRIAMSLFKGFMVSTNLKCIVVNSFELISYNINSDKFITVLDSGTTGYYGMIKDNVLTTFLALEERELIDLSKEYKIVSDIDLNQNISYTKVEKSQNALVDCVKIALSKGNIKNEYELEPLYVKKAQSEREYKQKFLSSIKIENASKDDLKDIVALENDNFKDNPYSESQILDDINQNRVICAKENNKVIGYLSYIVSDQVEILKICVEEDKRNLGIGQTLINKLSFYQKDIFLEVSEKNIAKNFYAKIGFKCISERKKYYKDGSDALIMVKRF